VEVLDADVVREKHRWMEGEGAILVGQNSHAVARLSFCPVSYAWWTAVGRGPWEALKLHASLALHTPCEWKFTHTWHLGAVENKGTFCMLSGSLRRPAVSVFHLSTCLIFFKGFDDFSFLGGGVVPSSVFPFFAWRSALWGRWFCDAESYLGGQGHTHGRAKCDAFAVVFEVEGELSNVIGSQGVRAM